MIFTWRDIVGRARVYLDDDHKETQGWILDDKWLELAKVEYQQLYRRWLRLGLVRPEPIVTQIHAGQYFIQLPQDSDISAGSPGVLAVIGVAENLVGIFRHLRSSQNNHGAYAPWIAPEQQNTGKATMWTASGISDSIKVQITPRDLGSAYFVRWLPIPPMPTSLDEQVELPFGCDERLVLGLARRAHLKDSGSSALLERLIVEADAEISFSAQGRLDTQAPRVRRIRRNPFHRRHSAIIPGAGVFPDNPDYWYYT